MESSFHLVDAALAHWKTIDEELRRVEELATAALASGAQQPTVHALTRQLADIRSRREKAYRTTLVLLQEHHDRVGKTRTSGASWGVQPMLSSVPTYKRG